MVKEIKNLRTLDEQIDALSEWDAPAERNYLEGLRRQRELGFIQNTKRD